MPLFTYKAENKEGKVVQETIQASNREEAASLLQAEELKVLTIKDVRQGVSSLFDAKISVAEKAAFCRFLGTMLRAGLSLYEAVEIIKQESDNKKMRKILADASSQIRKGRSLSVTLSQYKEVFDPVFLTIVKAGEESGSLEKAFDYLAKQLSRSYEFSQKIKGALMYPLVIITAMVGVGFLMIGFVLPKISVVFLKMNIELPAITRMILSFGKFVGENLFLALGGMFGSLVLLAFIIANPKSRKAMLLFLSKFPAVKKLMNQIDVARFSRTLSVLLKSGVSIVDALNVSTDSLTQPKLFKRAKQFSSSVAKGESLSQVLVKGKRVFPLIMIQTIKTGEKTGALEQVLEELADFYESEVDFRLKRLTSLIEPVLMLVIGIAVGIMVIMVVAPIYSIVGGLQETIGR